MIKFQYDYTILIVIIVIFIYIAYDEKTNDIHSTVNRKAAYDAA